MSYVTTIDVERYLNISLTDPEGIEAVNEFIAGAESAIEAACNRSWSNGASHTEKFDGGHDEQPDHRFINHLGSNVPVAIDNRGIEWVRLVCGVSSKSKLQTSRNIAIWFHADSGTSSIGEPPLRPIG